jgi:hypothetical protein
MVTIKNKGLSLKEIESLSGKQIYSPEKWKKLRSSKYIYSISNLGIEKKGKKGVMYRIIFEDKNKKRKEINVFF